MTIQMIATTLPATAWADCYWSNLITDQARVAVVRPGSAAVPFTFDRARQGCPSSKDVCRSPVSVTPGDIVVISLTQGPYTCAGFTDAKGMSTIHWLPTEALAPLPDSEQQPDDWTGDWVGGGQNISIASGSSGALRVKGNATWGAGASEHVGEIEGTARPDHGVLAFTMGESATLPYDKGEDVDCRVRMIRRGPYLLVRDNKECGGVNVSFSDLYRRKR